MSDEPKMSETAARLQRDSVPDLDAILGDRLPVLDDGFVRVVDYLGSDRAVVQAARVSYGDGTKAVHEDRGLIRYLMRHRHTTPFEMCEVKFHVRVPMDCWRQWIRHRMASVNEYSTRYSLAIDAAQSTKAGAWREQTAANRQGSAGHLHREVGAVLTRAEAEFHRYARHLYEERIALGVAREQARKDLPLSTYTEAYWKIDLHNLLHFLSLRLDAHAQEEIRRYAEAIARVVQLWVPETWAAFEDYRLTGITLSGPECAFLQGCIDGEALREVLHAAEEQDKDLQGREQQEFASKMARLGVRL